MCLLVDRGDDMDNFTPITSLIGGIMIGLSASAMLLLEGKIAGISGIFAGVLNPAKGEIVFGRAGWLCNRRAMRATVIPVGINVAATNQCL